MPRRVSLCMIARDEEANLPGCLGPVADLMDEIIVVDTGSSDRTKEAAATLGARVVDFPWIDDFAAARNEGLKHATGDWIFWLDADDRIDRANRGSLQPVFDSLGEDNAAYLMRCEGVADAARGPGGVTQHVRLFRNHPDARWQYRVHEQILPALRRLGAELRQTDVTIQHTGYRDPALHVQKCERNLRLLELTLAENPGDPHPLFYLGQTYLTLGQVQRALPFLQESLRHAVPGNPLTPRLYVLLTQTLYQAGQTEEAFAISRAGRLYFPDNPDLLFLEGAARQAGGDAAGGEACLQQLLVGSPESRALTIDPGVYAKARQRLAFDYLRQGRFDEAEAQWRAVLGGSPDATSAWLGLADVCLARGRPELWAPFLESLEATGPNSLHTALVTARFLEARGDFVGARTRLEEACARHGHSIWPHMALARTLLQEGRDWPAAERALRTVLALDPVHGEARRYLGQLHRQQHITERPTPPSEGPIIAAE